MWYIAYLGLSLLYRKNSINNRSENLEEKDLEVDKNSQETVWSNKKEDENISKVVTEEMEEEDEYEIKEFDD